VTRRLLVVANETAAGVPLRDAIGVLADDGAEVLVIAPALNTRLGYWAGDDRRARRSAAERLAYCLDQLAAVGIRSEGFVADSDPLLAIEDALRVYDADRILISTHPDGQSNWLARGIVERARERFPQPVEHVVAARRRAAA
jgi:hypothetical protein